MASATRTPTSAGRGLLSITGAKAYFIVTSYAALLLLPRFLGSPEQFGLFRSALNVVSILNNVLIVATIQTVSKQVTQDLDRADVALREAIRLQLVVGAILGGAMALVGPRFASAFLLDPALEPLLRVSSLVVICYAVYAAFVGSLNGRRIFQRQALLDVSFSTLRSGGMLLAAGLGLGALGAMVGFASAAVVIVIVAALIVGIGRGGSRTPWRTWLAFLAPLWLYHALLNGILMVDLALLKRTATVLALESGLTAEPARELSSTLVGFYGAAQTFAFVPYQLNLSLAFVIFPMISEAAVAGDTTKAKAYVRNAMRFSLLMLLSIAAPLAGAATGVMRLAYPSEYLAGSGALEILVLTMCAFALFVIAATALTSAGQPFRAALIAFVALGVVVGCNLLFVRWVGIDAANPGKTLAAAAWGTSVGVVVALALACVALFVRFGTVLPLKSLARGLLAGAAAFCVARVVPHSRPVTALVALAAGFVVFGAVLIISREVSRSDLSALRRSR